MSYHSGGMGEAKEKAVNVHLTLTFVHLAFLHIADSAIVTYSKSMKRILYFLYLLIQCTWGLGQTVIGLFFFLIHITKPHKFYRGAIETRWNDPYAGLSLGPFIFVPNNEGEYFTGARVHEYGHTIQSLVLGPFYAIVGVISVGWGSLVYPILKRTEKYKDLPYTKCFVEYNASWLGEKVTGEKAVW